MASAAAVTRCETAPAGAERQTCTTSIFHDADVAPPLVAPPITSLETRPETRPGAGVGPLTIVPAPPQLAATRAARLFDGLSWGDCASVAAAARERTVTRRNALFREGDPVRDVSILCSGRIKLTQLSVGGAEVILAVKNPGEVVGGLVNPTGNHSLSAHALDDCSLLVWDRHSFATLTERFPAIGRNAVQMMAEYVRNLEERVLELSTDQVAQRLAKTLVRLLKHMGFRENGAVRISLSREELAQMTGTTLFTVSRLLSAWEAHGFIGARREAVLIYNPDALMQYAESV